MLGPNAYRYAFCHLPNGQGKQENAPVNSLPVEYLVRHIHAIRNGLRRSAEHRKANTLVMILLAQAMSEAEIMEAVEYLAKVPYKPRIRVVKTERVPRTTIVSNLFVPIETVHTELLAGRIMKCRRMQKPPNPCAIPTRDSSLTCRSAASSVVKPWLQPAAPPWSMARQYRERPSHALRATAPISWAWRGSRDCRTIAELHRPDNFTTSSRGRGKVQFHKQCCPLSQISPEMIWCRFQLMSVP